MTGLVRLAVWLGGSLPRIQEKRRRKEKGGDE